MKSYFVLLRDFNSNKTVKHDIMPYILQTYKECEEKKFWWMFDDPKIAPIAKKKDFKHFVERVCKHMYWSRCEYEWLMISWPPGKMDTLEQCQKIINSSTKIDAWEQIEMNLDIITDVFIENIKSV